MSGKLDQSLDDIVKTRRQTARKPGRGRGAGNAGRAPTTAPIGGVSKGARGAKQPMRGSRPLVPITGSGESKIIVSGLVGLQHQTLSVSRHSRFLAIRRLGAANQGMWERGFWSTCLFSKHPYSFRRAIIHTAYGAIMKHCGRLLCPIWAYLQTQTSPQSTCLAPWRRGYRALAEVEPVSQKLS